jgi:hypothetical protein
MRWAGNMAQVEEYLPRKCEPLSSNPVLLPHAAQKPVMRRTVMTDNSDEEELK